MHRLAEELIRRFPDFEIEPANEDFIYPLFEDFSRYLENKFANSIDGAATVERALLWFDSVFHHPKGDGELEDVVVMTVFQNFSAIDDLAVVARRTLTSPRALDWFERVSPFRP